MQKRTVIFFLVLALIVSASFVTAAGRMRSGKGPGMMGGGRGACPMMGPMMIKQLGLSDAQVAQMKQLHEEFKTATQATRDQIKEKAKAMGDLWAADEPDADAIKAAAAEIDDLKAQMRDTGIDYMIKGLKIMTPAQREKLRTMMKNRPDWCPCPGCGMGFGMGGGWSGGGMRSGAGGMGRGPQTFGGECMHGGM